VIDQERNVQIFLIALLTLIITLRLLWLRF
jgi:hypothetical protein